jgi:hypothetical protein
MISCTESLLSVLSMGWFRMQSEAMKFETKTKKIIADPSYFPSKSKVTGYLLKAS